MPSTVALLSIALMSCVMSAAVLGSLLRANVRGVARWCAAYGIFSVGIGLVLDKAHVPPWLGIAFAHGLFLLGSFAILQGAREFFGRNKATAPEYAAVVAVYIALLYFIYVRPNLDASVFVTSAYFAYIRAAVGWTALRYRPAHRPKYSYYFLGIAALVGALLHLARSIAYGFGWDHQTAFLDPSPLNIAFLGLGILSFPFMSIGMVMLAHDRLAERMERLATIDELTGSLVRRAFMERADAAVAASQASGTPLALAILDLDNFKAVNDRHGHAAGDCALVHFASTVLKSLRSGDLFGRLGGEEFAVLFPATREAEALQLMNGLRLAIAAHPCGQTPYTFSAGVDEFGPGDRLARVLARADAALYTAKALGRDCVVMASSHGESDEQVEQPG
ncbi:GGDEF domain-containing protein [Trinickia dinghuensis]|uniref:diguanylate cyclase n=1 Tax=Trinickia dinghuensis TaxID=2291023 RepID=A0A3D8JXX1_9BURK|nr:GGDEF domain-containing protein [Trinickia dinghuensis]RDU97496.1 GGDEF domain-containing protein [Trinickia dinghuensis]